MPSPISREDVAHLASLARIDLSEAELEQLGAELPDILAHVATVQEAVQEPGAGDAEAMSHPQPISNVFREDVVTPGLSPDEALAGAPAAEDQRFLVPRILGEE
ncbi:Asp-tRNA(Asn)/Glu-tRNA(Gln) amidotransferase subunit GatC [Aeromicrobium sp. CTD01-1L150]|uniref:Asp-tRNA(Asn)/Glu-tRNA(Gln) amidotransferase subunit GatC n=1 Tax=Aeromicrobium sp. CTD01-1L150 TaxID=3341830 RepID=UPI0035BF4EA3